VIRWLRKKIAKPAAPELPEVEHEPELIQKAERELQEAQIRVEALRLARDVIARKHPPPPRQARPST
jgi:hypothetical protein